MTVRQYHLADGTAQWLFVLDLPAGSNGKRRQAMRRGFRDEAAALAAEAALRKEHGAAVPASSGTVAGELIAWLSEREIDLAQTSHGWYRDVFRAYVIPYIGDLSIHRLDSRMINGL